MSSKNKQKYIQSLYRKKNRAKEAIFIAEGRKTIELIIDSEFEIVELFGLDASATYVEQYQGRFTEISQKELSQLSQLQHPDDGLALVRIPNKTPDFDQFNELVVYLDRLNDPGNLGTILRLCEWFGCQTLLVNKGTTDVYQPKVVQASMGALAFVDVFEVDNNCLDVLKTKGYTVATTAMQGKNIFELERLSSKTVLILGNEANGISDELFEKADQTLSIPKDAKSASESLNVAMACGILLAEFSRLSRF
ncbi:MAG: TrmH family RNA methyltransferase [Flavobacteriales bacterium]